MAALFYTLFPLLADCPFSVYLSFLIKKYDDPRVKTLLVGQDEGWATNLKKSLPNSEPFLIYMQEDYLLQSPVNTSKIFEILNYAEQQKDCINRLIGSPDPSSDDKEAHHSDLKEIKKRRKI